MPNGRLSFKTKESRQYEQDVEYDQNIIQSAMTAFKERYGDKSASISVYRLPAREKGERWPFIAAIALLGVALSLTLLCTE